MGNKTAVAEDQVSSQNVHNAQQINQADNNPEQTAQTEPKSSPLSLKVKLIISAVVIVMLAGLGVGIYFIVDHFSPKIRVQKSSAFSFPDRTNIVVHKVRVTDINVKQDNQNLTLFVASTGRSGSGRRLQQVDYDVFIKDHGSGLTIRRPTIKGGFGGKVQFLLSPGLFLNAIDQEDQARMLQTDVSAPLDANIQAECAEIETNLLSTLNDLFSDAIEEYTNDIVTFKEKRYQTYRLADGEFKLQPAPAHARLLVKVKKGGGRK